MTERPVVIIGAGGHAKVLLEILRLRGSEILGFTDLDPRRAGQRIHGLTILGGDASVLCHDPRKVLLVNGVGSTGTMDARKEVFERFMNQGYDFASVIHPGAIISSTSELGTGVQVLAGAVIQVDARISFNCIVNTGAIVEHDCQIDAHVHLAPGVTLSGGVVVGEETHIGTGATIVQGVVVGRRCTVAAGAVVLANVNDGTKVAGIPAKEIKN
jgi:sugar O-acyltransferase (sialic acid O-acetyltransferase NeuD family)